jgi:exonuclease SbcC
MKLRKENLAYINAYTNEVFRDLYQSSAYERVILNDDYTISLLKSNGMTISPKLSSGGESAIVNIALRAGIYRTIAERNQGSMSTLPPLILDEPTTFLDSTHVRELETVINSIQQWNVAQVFIVSHDDSLIDAADYEYEVTKSASSDVSSCSLKQANKSV